MKIDDVLKIGSEIISENKFNIERYKKSSLKKLQNSNKIYTLSNIKLTENIDTLNKLRKEDRFLSFATSTVISFLDFNNVDKIIAAEFFHYMASWL